MSDLQHVGFNPLTWFSSARASGASSPPLVEIYRQIREAGFRAVHAEIPDGMSVQDYRGLLSEVGLEPAPGYFSAPFSDSAAMGASLERARRVADQQAQLGLDRIFIADQFGAAGRVDTPARGVGFDAGRLHVIVEHLGNVAAAMAAEGVLACLHQHVGTWIESLDETTTVLDAIPADILLFGPDTGHLTWVGGDPSEIIGRYRQRVGAVHLKDIRLAVAAAGHDYREAGARHVWTEPGRGDVDFEAVLRGLSGFEGWYVVEVDVADQPTPKECAIVSARWVHDHFPQ